MTTHLFDTNAWLRACQCPEELSPATHALLAASREPFMLSVISIWEVCLKVRKGKLLLTTSLDSWLSIALRPSFIRLISIDAAIAREANALPAPFHEDPADRFIVATARLRSLTVVTSDGKMIDYPAVQSFDTR